MASISYHISHFPTLQILLNKAILSIWSFGFPFFLTGWHMLFGMVLTQILSRTTGLLPGVKEVRQVQYVRDDLSAFAGYRASDSHAV